MFARITTAALLTALVGTAGATAATRTADTRPDAAATPAAAKTMSVVRTRPGTVRATLPAATTVVAISAFPTGGKGSGTEATCALWTERLQDDQALIDGAPETDKDDASGPLEQDIDNALDAGCAVIY